LANDAAVAIDMQLGRIHDELGGGDPDALWKALIDVDFLVCAMEDPARWQLGRSEPPWGRRGPRFKRLTRSFQS
jgi:hypothetical protein